ncbi:tail fiber domain-containing protein [Novosphingobium olei]|uniref:tail fiber domain-containing protein n=1 Tax=Novosphingobium olei TaxID=2728851 RepID=UPI0030935F21|nr:hypothetical protein NSDW_32860 [Novosphingobium olei]
MVDLSTTPRLIMLGDNTLLAAQQAQRATTAAAAAAASQAAAEGLVGPVYASTSAGIAATTSGKFFAVNNGDGTVTIYLNSSGSAVAQRTIGTVAYNDGKYASQSSLAGTGGAAQVGKSGGGTVQDHISSWGSRNVGTAASGTTTPAQVYPTLTGASDGSTDYRTMLLGVQLTGANSASLISLMSGQSEARHTAGTLTFQYGLQGFNRLGRLGSATGDVITCRGVEWHTANEGTGNITTAFDFYAQDVDLLDGTGTIGTMVGFKCGNQGHASRITTAALGFDCGNMSSGAPLTAAFRSEMTSGTGRWAFLGAGSAPSALAGNLRIGDNTSPSRTLSLYGSDVWQQFENASRKWIIGAGSSADFQVYDETGASTRLRVAASDGSVQPGADNTQTIGAAGKRWSQLHAATSTIATSDERSKTFRSDLGLSPAELNAARRIIGELGFYQWNDALAEKGPDGARWHFGPRAQEVARILVEEGLEDAFDDSIAADVYVESGPSFRTAFLCFDTWQARYEDDYETVTVQVPVQVVHRSKYIVNSDGEPIETVVEIMQDSTERRPTGTQTLVQAAGNRFGLRIEQLALFLIAAQEQRIAALES